MAASDHLNQQLFHGSYQDIEGGKVMPAAQAGKRVNFLNLSNPATAYATETEEIGWKMADIGSYRGLLRDKGVPQRTRVYEVAPHPAMRMGDYHSDSPDFGGEQDLREWTAPSFDVKSRQDIRPGRQGTFTLNWNQFKKHPTYSVGEDEYNHPTDEVIEQGHWGGQMRNQASKDFWDPEEDIKKRVDKKALEDHPRLF